MPAKDNVEPGPNCREQRSRSPKIFLSAEGGKTEKDRSVAAREEGGGKGGVREIALSRRNAAWPKSQNQARRTACTTMAPKKKICFKKKKGGRKPEEKKGFQGNKISGESRKR